MPTNHAETPRKSVILISSDLSVGSQLTGVANGMGFEFRQQLSGGLKAEELASCQLAIIDLASPAATSIEQFAGDCHTAGTHVLAFGPHVQVERLERARNAGCDRVVTRGSVVGELRAALIRMGGRSSC